MKKFSLKALYEGSEIAFIDIDITENHSLRELHDTIVKTLGYSGEQLAAFYEINDIYEVINEIGLADFMTEKQQMDNVLISDLVADVNDQLLYTYDFLNEYKFTIECMEVSDSKESIIKVTKKFGEFPKENKETISNEEAESILINAIMGDDFEDEDDDIFEDENFESLDDYEGLI